jgi:L-alanine-DL-glutamate epimerase-like enolase superfamily enzyme
MKITSVTSTPVAVPLRATQSQSQFRSGPRVIDSVIVQVVTDDGLVGLGEAPPVLGADMTHALITNAAGDLVGWSPFHVNRAMKHLYASHNLAHVHPHAANWALNGIEMALWDLIGKACGRPLHEVWGGPYRLDVPFYGHVERQTPDAMREEARALAERGFDTLYTKIGFGRDEDVAAVRAIREGAPAPQVRIRVDANQSWTPGQAITMIKDLEPYGLEFVDQPVLMFNLDALVRVKEAVSVPIAAHESGWTMYEVLNVIKRNAADVIHIDPRFDLGLTGARISAGTAEAAGIPVVAHSFGELGIAFAAMLQLVAATPNFTLANQEDGYRLLTDDVVREGPLAFNRNCVTVPSGAGLGVTLDPERLAQYAEFYQREVLEKYGPRGLHTTAYSAMYLRSYLRAPRSLGDG